MKKILVVILLCLFNLIYSQDLSINRVIAIVGNRMIMKSDIYNTYIQSEQDAKSIERESECEILELLLFQKLLSYQADVDSLVVSDKDVEEELDKRIKYFISVLGSKEKVEQYFNKTIIQIKNDFSESIKEELLAKNQHNKIVENIKITPSEVRDYYNSLSKDSIPDIPAEVEVGQITIMPKANEELRNEVIEKLKTLKLRIEKGELFSTLAILYSQDGSSALKGGEVGYIKRGTTLYPEFEAAAFRLKEGEISDIIETKSGFHILQLIERRGDEVNVRHILLKPKVDIESMNRSKLLLDSIVKLIKEGKLSFEEAAQKYSDDSKTKNNGGMLVNVETGSTRIPLNSNNLDPNMIFMINKMNSGELSAPFISKTEDGNDIYKVIYLKSKIELHKANLKDDYQIFYNMALQDKQNRTIYKWINNKKMSTYIYIDDSYKNCTFKNDWLN